MSEVHILHVHHNLDQKKKLKPLYKTTVQNHCTIHFKSLGVSVAHFCSAAKAALILSMSILGTLVGSSEQSSSAV